MTEPSSPVSVDAECDNWERRIREKVWESECLTAGEWVYLVGLFQTAREHERCSAATTTDPLYDSRNPNHGRIGGLYETPTAPDEAARTQLPPVDEVARIMWEGDHDGTWSDPHDGQDESKVIYSENASVAMEFIREWQSRHLAQPSPIKAPGNDQLSKLWNAIVENTRGDGFWIGEILLTTLEREVGFNPNGPLTLPERGSQ